MKNLKLKLLRFRKDELCRQAAEAGAFTDSQRETLLEIQAEIDKLEVDEIPLLVDWSCHREVEEKMIYEIAKRLGKFHIDELMQEVRNTPELKDWKGVAIAWSVFKCKNIRHCGNLQMEWDDGL